MRAGLESRVELMVSGAVEAGGTDRVVVDRSRLDRDLLISIGLTGPERHVLVLRVREGGVLLDVDGSQAMEFAEVDGRDMADLERVVRAYCLGELEVQVDLRDGMCHALRMQGQQLGFPRSVLRWRRPGRKVWRRIG